MLRQLGTDVWTAQMLAYDPTAPQQLLAGMIPPVWRELLGACATEGRLRAGLDFAVGRFLMCKKKCEKEQERLQQLACWQDHEWLYNFLLTWAPAGTCLLRFGPWPWTARCTTHALRQQEEPSADATISAALPALSYGTRRTTAKWTASCGSEPKRAAGSPGGFGRPFNTHPQG